LYIFLFNCVASTFSDVVDGDAGDAASASIKDFVGQSILL